tara:strand:- start:1353 stop:1541 length:189 start_codon:yes stop_codon:yes gene_type:complete
MFIAPCWINFSVGIDFYIAVNSIVYFASLSSISFSMKKGDCKSYKFFVANPAFSALQNALAS